MPETADTNLRACWSNLLDQIERFATLAAPIYALNNWTWVFTADDARPPTAKEIHSLTYSLAWEAYQHAEKSGTRGFCSSGRLCVQFNKYNDNWSGRLSLEPLAVCSSGER